MMFFFRGRRVFWNLFVRQFVLIQRISLVHRIFLLVFSSNQSDHFHWRLLIFHIRFPIHYKLFLVYQTKYSINESLENRKICVLLVVLIDHVQLSFHSFVFHVLIYLLFQDYLWHKYDVLIHTSILP